MSLHLKRLAAAPKGAAAAAGSILAVLAGIVVSGPHNLDLPVPANQQEQEVQADADGLATPSDLRSRTTLAARELVPGPCLKAEKIAHDWGEAVIGQSVRHRFLVRNEGDQTARLVRSNRLRRGLDVKFDQEIQPGGIGMVEVNMPTEAMSEGRAQVSLEFQTNSERPLMLLMHGELVAAGR